MVLLKEVTDGMVRTYNHAICKGELLLVAGLPITKSFWLCEEKTFSDKLELSSFRRENSEVKGRKELLN